MFLSYCKFDVLVHGVLVLQLYVGCSCTAVCWMFLYCCMLDVPELLFLLLFVSSSFSSSSSCLIKKDKDPYFCLSEHLYSNL